MHYFWFIPVLLVMVGGIWVLYLVVARGLPRTSTRSVEDALAEEPHEDEMTKTATSSGTLH